MGRRTARLTVDTLHDLPELWRRDLFWELDPVRRQRLAPDDAVSAKEAWLSRVLLEWGSCGRVLYVDDGSAHDDEAARAVGFVVYAPPGFFPGTAVLPTAPVAEDAVQLATAHVLPEYAGGGLGRVLMQLMVKDLLERRDVRAVECIGVDGTAPMQSRSSNRGESLLPAAFLQRVGFKTQRAHPFYPRMRLDLRAVVSWRTDVEAALERILSAVRPVSRPAPVPREDDFSLGVSLFAGTFPWALCEACRTPVT